MDNSAESRFGGQRTGKPTQSGDAARDQSIDVFLSYNSSDRDVVRAVRERLSASGVATFFDRQSLAPGLPWIEPLQTAILRSGAVAVFLGKDGLGVWQKREMALALARQAQGESAGLSFPVIPVLLPGMGWDDPPGFLKLNTAIELDDPGALEAIVRAVRGETLTPSRDAPPVCPYRGLNAFREEDAPLFFGREKVSQTMLGKVREAPLVAVVGASGSGKSSVVKAGLLPLLRRERPPESTWGAVVFRPGDRPYHRFAAALVATWEPDVTRRTIATDELSDHLAARGQPAFETALAAALKHSESADRLLVVIDQFEEIFTPGATGPQRRPFVDALLAAAAVQPVTILLTLRADYYGKALVLSRALSDAMAQGIVNLGPMTRGEIRDAAEQPAQLVGVEFAPGLVNRILDHVEGQPGHLPLLEFALTELWGRLEGRALTHQAYQAIGEVDGAISRTAERVIGRLSCAEQTAAIRAFTRLVRVSAANEEGTDTRLRVRLSDLGAEAQVVIGPFVVARLLVMGRDAGNGEETVEVAHEALIRNWPLLDARLNRDRAFLLWRQRLSLQVEDWKKSRPDTGALLRGVPLEVAGRWLRERGAELNAEETIYIRTSQQESRPKGRRLAGVVAAVLLAGVTGSWFWTRSEAYQVAQIESLAPDLVRKSDQPGSVSDWVLALFLTDQGPKAVAAAGLIREPGERLRVIARTVGRLARAGKTDAVRLATDSALRAAAQLDPPNRPTALAYLVAELAKAEQFPEARAIADGIDDAFWRKNSLVRLAQSLTNARRFDEAERTAGAVFSAPGRIDPAERCGFQADFVDALVTAGQTERAVRAADSALEAANRVEGLNTRPFALARAARAQSIVGQTDKAVRVAESALAAARLQDNPSLRSMSMSMVAIALARSGKPHDAGRVADEAFAESSRAEQPLADQLTVVEVLAGGGMVDSALRAARKIQDGPGQTRALVVVAIRLAKEGRTGEAIGVARECLRGSYPERMADDEIVNLASAGMARGLVEIATGIDSARERARVLTVVTAVLRREGNLVEARRAADATKEAADQDKYELLVPGSKAAAAMAFARTGRVREGLEIAGRIRSDHGRSQAMTSVAIALARSRDFRGALGAANECPFAAYRLEAYSQIVIEYYAQGDPKLREQVDRLARAGLLWD